MSRDTAAEVIEAAQELADSLDGYDFGRVAEANLHRLQEALLTHERLQLAKEAG